MVKWGITMTTEKEKMNSYPYAQHNAYGITYEFWKRMENLFGRNIYPLEIVQIKKRMDELEKEVNNG